MAVVLSTLWSVAALKQQQMQQSVSRSDELHNILLCYSSVETPAKPADKPFFMEWQMDPNWSIWFYVY